MHERERLYLDKRYFSNFPVRKVQMNRKVLRTIALLFAH